MGRSRDSEARLLVSVGPRGAVGPWVQLSTSLGLLPHIHKEGKRRTFVMGLWFTGT